MMSEKDILSDDKKKTPADYQGRRSRERLIERPWLNLCVAPRSPVVRLVVYFRVVEVIEAEVLSGQVEESERIRCD